MRPAVSLALLLLLLVSLTTAAKAETNLDSLAREAVSNNQTKSAKAIAALRRAGPAGLEAMFTAHAAAINEQIANPLMRRSAEWERLSTALDAVSQQKNSYLSHLYWYTDLDDAEAAAKKSGKPILSLRLLGKLSEEFSCANSRFFRTILYSNAAISRKLREDFILHWKSVRPVPHVTIDFGDGRKLERTLTGNSIHYILDSQGRVIEALPGLYGPRAFLRALLVSERVFAKLTEAKNANPGLGLITYRQRMINEFNMNWVKDIEKAGGKLPAEVTVVRRPDGSIEAFQIAQLAVTKMATEANLLRSLTANAESLGKVTDEVTWKKIAKLHAADSEIDARSIGLIQRETRKVIGERELRDLLTKLQENVALDTVRNEYLMRSRIYAWLVHDRGRSSLETFNDKIYDELFLTPASDPWLGLFTADTYMALDDSGVVR